MVATRLTPLRICALLLPLLALAAKAAVIEGVVLENKTGKPLVRARITLENVKDGSPVAPVFTDSAGAFRFAGLAAGTYQLTAERSGFLRARFGQSRFDSAASPILIPADGHFFAQMYLWRPGLITGAVLDENGVGISNFSISAFRTGTRPKMVAAANTNERGVYRFASLEPGRYVLLSSARLLDDGTAFLPTFYGQAKTAAEARPVDIQLDSEVAGADISPLPGHLTSVRGKVDAAGVLAVQMLGDLGMQETPTRADGSFEFTGIAPGSYLVTAHALVAGGGGAVLSAAVPVTVQEESRFVPLSLGPSPTLQLQCLAASTGAATRGLALFLERDRFPDDEDRRLDCGKEIAVPAGNWRLRPLPLSNAYLQSLDEAKPPNTRSDWFSLSLAPGDRKPIIALLAERPATLKGQLMIGNSPGIGIPVGLVAVTDETHRQMGGARLTRTDADGNFRFDGLAPGDYRLVSMPGLETVESVEALGSQGRLVRLAEGEQLAIELPWQP